MNKFLDVKESITRTLESNNRAISLLIAKAKSNGGFSLDIFFRIFDATVAPIIEFSAHLWAFKECPKVNQIQYNALSSSLVWVKPLLLFHSLETLTGYHFR